MTAKKPRGRPALDPTEKKRKNFTFRGTDQLHEELSKASAASGRSVSEEIEARLNESFTRQNVEHAVELAAKLAAEATIREITKVIGQREPAAVIAALLNHREPAAVLAAVLNQLGEEKKKDSEK